MPQILGLLAPFVQALRRGRLPRLLHRFAAAVIHLCEARADFAPFVRANPGGENALVRREQVSNQPGALRRIPFHRALAGLLSARELTTKRCRNTLFRRPAVDLCEPIQRIEQYLCVARSAERPRDIAE